MWPGIPDTYRKLPESDSGSFRYTRSRDYQSPTRHALLGSGRCWKTNLYCHFATSNRTCLRFRPLCSATDHVKDVSLNTNRTQAAERAEKFRFCPWWPWPLTLTFKLGRDFCIMHLTDKFYHPTFSRSQVMMRTNKQTPLKTSTSLRYATPVGNHHIRGMFKPPEC